MSTDYPERRKQLVALLAQMGKALPGPAGGFARLHRDAVTEGTLSTKVKELIAMAIAMPPGAKVASHCMSMTC